LEAVVVGWGQLAAHKAGKMKHPELVAERLVRPANLIGPQNIMAGTDCGFAQRPFVRRVHPSVMWAKLSALSQRARLASAELWRT
jgi:5-methyltetrahydropteroyltriglutamate--homocysteine methyltransferase